MSAGTQDFSSSPSQSLTVPSSASPPHAMLPVSPSMSWSRDVQQLTAEVYQALEEVAALSAAMRSTTPSLQERLQRLARSPPLLPERAIPALLAKATTGHRSVEALLSVYPEFQDATVLVATGERHRAAVAQLQRLLRELFARSVQDMMSSVSDEDSSGSSSSLQLSSASSAPPLSSASPPAVPSSSASTSHEETAALSPPASASLPATLSSSSQPASASASPSRSTSATLAAASSRSTSIATTIASNALSTPAPPAPPAPPSPSPTSPSSSVLATSTARSSTSAAGKIQLPSWCTALEEDPLAVVPVGGLGLTPPEVWKEMCGLSKAHLLLRLWTERGPDALLAAIIRSEDFDAVSKHTHPTEEDIAVLRTNLRTLVQSHSDDEFESWFPGTMQHLSREQVMAVLDERQHLEADLLYVYQAWASGPDSSIRIHLITVGEGAPHVTIIANDDGGGGTDCITIYENRAVSPAHYEAVCKKQPGNSRHRTMWPSADVTMRALRAWQPSSSSSASKKRNAADSALVPTSQPLLKKRGRDMAGKRLFPEVGE